METMDFLKPILKRRFTTTGVWVEAHILDILGQKYYDGDRATWELHRIEAYHQWKKGWSAEDIAFWHELPIFIVHWWVEIWNLYNKAWGFLNEK